jgi:hypothetical protein
LFSLFAISINVTSSTGGKLTTDAVDKVANLLHSVDDTDGKFANAVVNTGVAP